MLLQASQLSLGQRHAAVLDAQRRVPQELLDLGNRLLVLIQPQALFGDAQPEENDRIVSIKTGPLAQITESIGHGRA